MKLRAMFASASTILVCAMVLTGSAAAAPIHYNITFTPGQITPTGSFDYNGSLPANQQFSNFLVTGSVTLDFTSAANNFVFGTPFSTSCAATPNVNDAFELLTHAPCVAAVATGFQWQELFNGARTLFIFGAQYSGGEDDLEVVVNAGTGLSHSFSGPGFLATPAGLQVPEPESLALIGIGVLAAVGAARRKRHA